MARLLNLGQAPHTGIWTAATTAQHLPTSLARLFSEETLSHLNVQSCLELVLHDQNPIQIGHFVPPRSHGWAGRLSYCYGKYPFFFWSAPVAFRRVALETPEWTSRDSNHHRQSVSAGKTNAIPTEPSGRLLLWEVPRDSRDLQAAIEDIVVFLNYLQKCYRDLNQGAMAQLLAMCNRTAVHTTSAAWLSGCLVWRSADRHNFVSSRGHRANSTC